MMYSGFVVLYTYGQNHPDKSVHFSQPKSTIEEAQKIYEDLLSLSPVVDNVRICRLVTNPSNPKLY